MRMTFRVASVLSFVELIAADDFAEYDRRARPEMKAEDLVSGEELRDLTRAGSVRSWYAVNGVGKRIGWCAVEFGSRRHPDPSAVHLLGNVVFGRCKGFGYGTAMAMWRSEQFPDRPLTAAVYDGNVASERVLEKCGFRRGLHLERWRTWHRPASRTSVLLTMEPERHAGPADGIIAAIQLDHVIWALRARGDYVEVAYGDAPKPISPEKPGLWPDPAAFTLLVDVSVPGAHASTRKPLRASCAPLVTASSEMSVPCVEPDQRKAT